MKIRALPLGLLSGEDLAAWSAMLRANPLLDSPFFRPEFSQSVAAVRNRVEVAVLEKDGRPVGFFPYERTRRNAALPVGTRLSDFHGIIAEDALEYDPLTILRACGLRSWRFDHLLSAQRRLAKFAYRHADSPFVDLSQGFESWASTLKSHFHADLRRTRRKLEHDLGPVRFAPDVRDATVFSTLCDWKSKQYERTNVVDVLGICWVRRLLERILEYRGAEFSAVMPVLYAGDRIVAISYMLRSGNVLHAWFPAYDRALSKYSPGMHMFMEVLRSASSLGIKRFDLGKGSADYKRTLQSGALQVAEGAVDLSPITAGARSAWWAVRGRIHTSRLHQWIQRPARTAYQLRCWMDLR